MRLLDQLVSVAGAALILGAYGALQRAGQHPAKVHG
jgi:hypothetical protein